MHSEETKRKIGLANTNPSLETRRKMSLAHKGQISYRKGKKFVDADISRQKKKEYRKKWNRENKEQRLEYNREFYKRHTLKMRSRSRIFYYKNREKELDRMRLSKYGITGDEFRKIIKEQNNQCPICMRSTKKNLSVDHNHSTGKIRGIICNDCNLAVANAGDSPKILRALAIYLEKFL